MSGPTKSRPSASRSASARREPPTPGSTTARWTPIGHVRERAREHERALEDLLPRDPVRDVDDLRLGRDPLDHAVARADEVVLEPEVAQEADEHAAEPIAASRPATSCVSASPDDLDPGLPGRGGRLRPDAHRRDRRRRAARTPAPPTPRPARRGHPRWRAPASARGSDRGRRTLRRARRRAAGALPRRPRRARGRPAAAARRAVPPASRRPGRGRRRRTRPRSPAPIAATRFGVPVMRRRSSRAPLTLVTITQS